MRVILIGCFHDLQTFDADPRPHGVLGPPEAEFGHAVQQHVVELAVKRNTECVTDSRNIECKCESVLLALFSSQVGSLTHSS